MLGSRILIAAPSNSAANLITERLIDSKILQEGQFLRVVGHNAVERHQIPDELKPYCGTIDIGLPAKEDADGYVPISQDNTNIVRYNSTQIQMKRILIGTCNSLGSIIQLKMPSKHFSHVIVDESGQCIEPEVMVPICCVKENGQIILAGDPMQLGPIVMSKYAENRGLDKSFLVRLLDRTPYARDYEVAFVFFPRSIKILCISIIF